MQRTNRDESSPPAPVDGDLADDELLRRPSRMPDFASENKTLVRLARSMAERSGGVLQGLAASVLELCRADSAGVSIVETDERGEGILRWHAAAGAFDVLLGSAMPRQGSPCSVVLDRGIPRLIAGTARDHGALASLPGPISEALLVPLFRDGIVLGTIWAVAHTDAVRFDAEDARLLGSLGELAAAAFQVRSSLEEREKADRRLRESEERFAFVLDSSGVGFWYCDLPFDMLQWDEHVKSHFHLPADALVSIETFYDRIHPEDREPTRRAIAQSIAGRTPYDVDYRTVDPRTGSEKWVRAIGRTFYAADGTPRRFDGVTIDVTDRKRAERQARRFADAAPAMLWVTDPAGSCTFLSREWYAFTGQTEEEALGLGWTKATHPDDQSEAARVFLSANDHRADFRLEYRVRGPGGAYRWALDVGRPHFSDAGDFLGMVGVVVVIQERKLAEDELRASEERFRLLDSLGEATRAESDPSNIMAITTRLLGKHLAVDRTAYADVEPDGDRFTIRQDWTAPGVSSTVGAYSLDLFGPRAAAGLRGGHTLVIRDVDAELTPSGGAGMFNAIGIRAVVCCPLVKGGRLAAMMAVHHAAPRDWSSPEIALVEEVVERSWAHIERVRDAAALREKDERLNLLVENVKDYAVIITDPEGTVIEWQGGAERITGFSPSEAVGEKANRIFTAEDRWEGVPEHEMGQAAEAGRAEDKRWHLRKDGTRFFADGVVTALYDDGGSLRGFGKVFRDATGEKKAEEERQELAATIELQARLFDAVLSNTPDFLYTFDLEGRFSYVNRALLDLLQKSSEQVVGKDFFEIEYPIELAARLQRQIQEVIETRGPVRDETPFASVFGARFYEYIFVPVLAPDGAVEAVAGSTRDITGRKLAEELARGRALQFQKLAEIGNRIHSARDVHSILGVVTEESRGLVGARRAATSVVLDPHHPQPINVTSNSERRPRGSNPPGIDGLALYEAINEARGPIRLTRGGLDADQRWRALRELADVGPTSNGWLAAPLVGRNGKNMGIIQLSDKELGEFTADDEAILLQLSQLASVALENARLYEELRSNDERKDEFLAMLAHELRNPLSAISGAVKLASRTDAKESLDWSMDVIARQMRHLSRLIDDLMDVSRITRGKIELRRDVVEIGPILESAAATVGPLAEERKHTLALAIPRGSLWAKVDPTRLEQVVVNLLNNAAKYSENSGHIQLTARNEANEVVVIVKDRGVGIPPERLPEMFELFAQGDRSLARSEGGLGIGLTVVKKLVEMHGGTIEARSEGTGKGSEFIVRLPAAKEPSQARPAAGIPTEAEVRKARILVVDDNVDTARGMARLLKLTGHEVETAHNGPDAIVAARAHRPEFVLLDIGLPGMSGYEVASQLRREECCKEAMIVAVSGYGQDEDRRRSKEAGFDHHLTKPLDHDALLMLLSVGTDGPGIVPRRPG